MVRRTRNSGRLIALLSLLFALTTTTAVRAAAPAKARKPPPEPQVVVPADANDLSLRIVALETLYEFDFSSEQLRALRTLAADTAQKDARTPAKTTPKLLSTMKELYAALLKADDDDKIGDLRDQLDEAKDDDDVDLDDDVDATDAALAKTPEAMRHVKASQIAAYLAVHAAEVSDPVEQIVDSLADLRSGDSDDPDADAQDAADDIARLVAGLDVARGKAVSEKVLAFFKANKDLKEEEFAARHALLEEQAKKLIGETPPMTVLTHWLESEVATLLSNPQLPAAIDAALAARAQRK